MAKPAAGGGRWVDVATERLGRWLARFHEHHVVTRTVVADRIVRVEAADGALAECHVPFPPLAPEGHDENYPGLAAEPLITHAQRDRMVGVLLVRLGGHAAGVFHGTRLVASKVDARPVHGRNKAGGQSQKRFQRRREEQARVATAAAGRVAERVLLPHVDDLEAVVLGGDRRAIDALRDDRRLRPVFALATDRFLSVPDPKRAVLERTPQQFRAVRIRVLEPASPANVGHASGEHHPDS